MILVISDYHRREERVLSLIKEIKPDLIWCLGDGESESYFYDSNNIVSVRGNCDHVELPLKLTFNHQGFNFTLTHGHMYQAYFGIERLYYLAKEENANFLLYGHTHVQKVENVEGITFLNPGSLLEDNYAIITDDLEIKLF